MKRAVKLLASKSVQLALYGVAFLCLYSAMHAENTALGIVGLTLTLLDTILIAVPWKG